MSSSPGPWSEKIVKKMMNNYLMILMPVICIINV